jgi:hypothetical protein
VGLGHERNIKNNGEEAVGRLGTLEKKKEGKRMRNQVVSTLV